MNQRDPNDFVPTMGARVAIFVLALVITICLVNNEQVYVLFAILTLIPVSILEMAAVAWAKPIPVTNVYLSNDGEDDDHEDPFPTLVPIKPHVESLN